MVPAATINTHGCLLTKKRNNTPTSLSRPPVACGLTVGNSTAWEQRQLHSHVRADRHTRGISPLSHMSWAVINLYWITIVPYVACWFILPVIIVRREIAVLTVITLLLNQQCSGGTSAERLVSITTNHTLSVRIMGKRRRRGRSDEWMAHLSIPFSPRANTTVFVSFHYIRANKESFDAGHIPPCTVPVSGVQYTVHLHTSQPMAVLLLVYFMTVPQLRRLYSGCYRADYK
jgi:hypothetical protein